MIAGPTHVEFLWGEGVSHAQYAADKHTDPHIS